MSHGLVTDQPISREELMLLRDRPVHVIGAASAEGVAVMMLLQRLGWSLVIPHDMRDRSVLRKAFRTTHGAYDRREQDAIWEQIGPFIDQARCGDDYLTGIADTDTISLGQGWYLDAANRANVVAAAPAHGAVLSMSSLYMALIQGPIAGITGTNGKSTTTAFVEHCFATAGRAVSVAGNERSSRQFLPQVDEVPADQWSLLEISNRQLLQMSASPQVAAITALTPDHLEEHGGMDGYVAAKCRLFSWQQPQDIAIACADDPRALAAAQSGPSTRISRCGCDAHEGPGVRWIGSSLVAVSHPIHDAAGGGVYDGVVADRSDVRTRGEHNLRNLAVGAAVALSCGVPAAAVREAIRTFTGKSLRLEHLAQVDGMDVWSDIKSTTPEATIAALDAMFDPSSGAVPGRVMLILGGDDKGLEYAPLAQKVSRDDVTVFAVPGSATDALEAALGATSHPAVLHRVADLAAALDEAFSQGAAGDCVIVSPAAAGFWSTQLQGGSSLRALVRRRSAVNTSNMEASNR